MWHDYFLIFIICCLGCGQRCNKTLKAILTNVTAKESGPRWYQIDWLFCFLIGELFMYGRELAVQFGENKNRVFNCHLPFIVNISLGFFLE
jgi:hypothetical protein